MRRKDIPCRIQTYYIIHSVNIRPDNIKAVFGCNVLVLGGTYDKEFLRFARIHLYNGVERRILRIKPAKAGSRIYSEQLVFLGNMSRLRHAGRKQRAVAVFALADVEFSVIAAVVVSSDKHRSSEYRRAEIRYIGGRINPVYRTHCKERSQIDCGGLSRSGHGIANRNSVLAVFHAYCFLYRDFVCLITICRHNVHTELFKILVSLGAVTDVLLTGKVKRPLAAGDFLLYL